MPTSDQLRAAGQAWFAANFQPNAAALRAQVVQYTNGLIVNTNIRLRSLYNQPMVYAGNRPPRYAEMAGWGAAQADGGVAAAVQVLHFINGTGGVTFDALPQRMKELVVITHVSEWGRYGRDAVAQLSAWMDRIQHANTAVAAAALWQAYLTEYPISLNAAQDQATDWYG